MSLGLTEICTEQCPFKSKSAEEIISAKKINTTGAASKEQQKNVDPLKEHTECFKPKQICARKRLLKICVFLFCKSHLETKGRQTTQAHKALQPEHAAAGSLCIICYSQGDKWYLDAVCVVIQNKLGVIVFREVHCKNKENMLIEKYSSPHSGLVVVQAQRFPALLHGHMDMEPAKKGQNCAGLIPSVLSDPSMSHPLSSWLFSPQAILLYSSLQKCRAFFYYSSASSLAQLHKPPSLYKAALSARNKGKIRTRNASAWREILMGYDRDLSGA